MTATSSTTKIETQIVTDTVTQPANSISTIETFPQARPGLLVTKELEKAIADCKARVESIAQDCRAKNRRFRDIEFDLENDTDRCVYGLFKQDGEDYTPADVLRITQIFDKPRFFSGSSGSSNDIVQGALGDCWFLSALATVSTAPTLVDKFCVARDELVGIYGFIFFKQDTWVPIIIDDLLCTSVPKWEELNYSEKALYHNEKSIYNKTARKGGKSLYFARSGDLEEESQTWVPLIEKAYAKLHGNYSHLKGGKASEGVEDLTGGVSSILQSKDILDIDRFWDEELMRANDDRLFGCAFQTPDDTRSGVSNAMVEGLVGNHSYSVLRAVLCNGKRFLVLRNPWGSSEWTGRWGDGSKEWTPEWLQRLPELGHKFGDDGQFVMEYSDWLGVFSMIDRTLLFDDTWIMSSQWLSVSCPPQPAAWSYGDVSFRFSLSAPTEAVIVLSQLDARYFRDIAGHAAWTLDFVLAKEGQREPIATSVHSDFFRRSVNLEVELKAGSYIVHIRLDRVLSLNTNTEQQELDKHQLRKLARILSQRAQSRSIASNFNIDTHKSHIPSSISDLLDKDAEEYEKKKREADVTTTKETVASDGTVTTTTTTTTTTTKVEKVVSKKGDSPKATPSSSTTGEPATSGASSAATPGTTDTGPTLSGASDPAPAAATTSTDDQDKIPVPHTDDNEIVIGLRVYTHKDVTCSLEGRLKSSSGSPTVVTIPATSLKTTAVKEVEAESTS